MAKVSQNRILAVCVVVLAVALIAVLSTGHPVLGRADGGSGGSPHYTVVETQGHNLLVTNNANNMLYFYTVDKDKPIGSPLKLRASMDLTKVGAEEIRITAHNVENSGK
jgi:hypothetical protein